MTCLLEEVYLRDIEEATRRRDEDPIRAREEKMFVVAEDDSCTRSKKRKRQPLILEAACLGAGDFYLQSIFFFIREV